MLALKELFIRAYEQPTDVGDAIIERLCWLEGLDEMIRGQRAVLTGVLGKLRATKERKLLETLLHLHSSDDFQAQLLQTSPVLLLDLFQNNGVLNRRHQRCLRSQVSWPMITTYVPLLTPLRRLQSKPSSHEDQWSRRSHAQ